MRRYNRPENLALVHNLSSSPHQRNQRSQHSHHRNTNLHPTLLHNSSAHQLRHTNHPHRNHLPLNPHRTQFQDNLPRSSATSVEHVYDQASASAITAAHV